jgi:alkanesulfonate monooxygenase
MTSQLRALGIRVFTTCPPSQGADALAYLKHVVRVARWSERAGCEGVLIYSDNRMVDPWLLAQEVIAATRELSPLIAVQPAYMHPFAVAKLVTTIAFLQNRRVYLNMVAGGFANDLAALNDTTPHDDRYARLTEYTQLVLSLLSSDTPVSHNGRFYRVNNLALHPPIEASMIPEIFISGSSDAGIAAAEQIGALAVRYPKPVRVYEEEPVAGTVAFGIRVGIIARERAADAWKAARARFPVDRRGQLTHQLAMKTSDSQWHKQLSELAQEEAAQDDPYWMHPFENYKTFCPYLVGSYDRVAEEIVRYVGVGCRTIILDVPAAEQELAHTGVVLHRAAERALV